jgi:hypothetical protein
LISASDVPPFKRRAGVDISCLSTLAATSGCTEVAHFSSVALFAVKLNAPVQVEAIG